MARRDLAKWMESGIWYVQQMRHVTKCHKSDTKSVTGEFIMRDLGIIGYTKIFSSMLDSSVWQLSKEARLLWLTMLLKKDQDQVVRAAVPGLAHAARLTVVETQAALAELAQADPWSRSKEDEGRRIREVEGGWLIVNGAVYRNKLSETERREYNRIRQRDRRARKRNHGKPLPGEAEFVKRFGDGEDVNAEDVGK